MEHSVLQIKIHIIRYRCIQLVIIIIIIFPQIEYSRKHNNNNVLQYNGFTDGEDGVSDDVNAHCAVRRRLYNFGPRDKVRRDKTPLTARRGGGGGGLGEFYLTPTTTLLRETLYPLAIIGTHYY